MNVGYLIIGALLGSISAMVSLFLGSSLLLAIAFFIVVSGVVIFFLAALQYALH
ncbi:hypothetical protein [Roseovarius sp. M141]|uniref:hypothetical protein n=1 Tax=Roseovarius sp. M141 TaxID=2583806 RepID=UPI0020CBD72E|nr:hypothetical protein [Roseovarius sp. M141]